MSTKSLKRLSVRAKRSISGLHAFCDVFDSADKENQTPDLGEFVLSPNYKTSMTPNVSPGKESPSRRKKLMGSLRSIGSLRGLRSSPLKEGGNERAAEPTEPVEPESPCTPVRTLVQERDLGPTSLTLNFERTLPDQPMFGALRRERSSSSLVVHHSSPVPIPTPVRPNEVPLGVPSSTSGFPKGKVPDTPAPLQKALEHDNLHPGTGPGSSPVHRQRSYVDQMPMPMPGTNLGFETSEIIGVASSTKGVGASLSDLPSELSSYFNIPVSNTSPRSDPNDADYASNSPVSNQSQEVCLVDTIIREDSSYVDVYNEAATIRQHDAHTARCDSMLSRYNHHDKKVIHEGNTCTRRAICERCYFNERAYMDQGSSPINIEHIIFDGDTYDVATDQPFASQTYLIRQIDAQPALQKQAQASIAPTLEPFPILDTDPKPAQNTWGTHGSIYDGTGYGDTPSPSSARPSNSSTATNVLPEMDGQISFTAASLARESEAMTRDHETLEGVIRAYAALEDEDPSAISGDVLGELVADIRADVELANDMAGYSLGA